MLTLIFGHPRTGRATNKRKRSWRCLDTLSIMLTLFGCQDVPYRRRGTRVAQAGRTESSDVVWSALVPTLHSLQAASLRSIAEETGYIWRLRPSAGLATWLKVARGTLIS